MIVRKTKYRLGNKNKKKSKIQRGGSGSPLNTIPEENAPTPIKYTKNLTHYWYNTWPDKGIPVDVEQFRSFLVEVYYDIAINGGNTVIHCSAGIGRTGVMYVCLMVLHQLLKLKFPLNDTNEQWLKKLATKDEFDKWLVQNKTDEDYNKNTNTLISGTLTKARKSRMMLVQGENQYNFIHNVFGVDKINFPEFIKYDSIPNLQNPEEQLCMNPKKNRYANIMPFKFNVANRDGTIGYKQAGPGIADPCEYYMNASVMYSNGEPEITNPNSSTVELINQTRIITSQCPILETIDSFKAMLWNHEVSRIVMLGNMKEGSNEKCDDYTDSKLLIDKLNPLPEYTEQNEGYLLSKMHLEFSYKSSKTN